MNKMENEGASSKSLLNNVLEMEDNYLNFEPRFYAEQNQFYDHFYQMYPEQKDPVEEELGQILKEIRVITEKLKDDAEAENAENDWKFAAMVLDRLCLWLFCLLSFFITVAIFAAAPHVIVY